MEQYDVIVIGGGHAGTEAALAAARMGASTLLVTQSLATVGQMSCNPAIGGIGKGHLVREIDAMGGAMAVAADRAGIQFRTLNASKGPAVRATRAQADRTLYKAAIRALLESQPNLALREAEVADLAVTGGHVTGVVTMDGTAIAARAVVLTVGTFLGGRIHVGLESREGGRIGDAPSNALAARLRELPFTVGRLKTGTPPRIDGRTLDYGAMRPQPGDEPRPVFSFLGRREDHPPAGPLPHHRDQRADARDHPRRDRPLADVHRPHRGRRPALLPLDRGQGRSLRGEDVAPDLPRARGPRHAHRLPERHLDEPARRRAARLRAHDRRLRARGDHAARLRGRVRLLLPERASRLAGDQGARRPVLRRPDQRHDRLRRSGGARPARGHQRRAPGRRPARPGRRAATRPTSA